MARARRDLRSPQQLRDDARNEQRMEMIPPQAFQNMANHLRAYLGSRYYKLDFLKALAKKTADDAHCHLDRCAKRKKAMLIVWFIENWDLIKDDLCQNLITLMQDPEHFLANEAPDCAPGIEEVEPDVDEGVLPATAQAQENDFCGLNDQEEDNFGNFFDDQNTLNYQFGDEDADFEQDF